MTEASQDVKRQVVQWIFNGTAKCREQKSPGLTYISENSRGQYSIVRVDVGVVYRAALPSPPSLAHCCVYRVFQIVFFFQTKPFLYVLRVSISKICHTNVGRSMSHIESLKKRKRKNTRRVSNG